jgi:peroxiredoxin family protein
MEVMEQVQPRVEQKIDPKPVRKMCFIVSKSSIDMVYAAMVMANGARMEGIEVELFFTFFGLDAITKKKMTHLHVASVGNPSLPIPTFLGGLPGMEALVTNQMKKEMERLDLPEVEEFMEMIHLSGGRIWACKLAMDMFKIDETDLVDYLDGVLTVGDFYEKAAGEGTHMVFI